MVLLFNPAHNAPPPPHPSPCSSRRVHWNIIQIIQNIAKMWDEVYNNRVIALVH